MTTFVCSPPPLIENSLSTSIPCCCSLLYVPSSHWLVSVHSPSRPSPPLLRVPPLPAPPALHLSGCSCGCCCAGCHHSRRSQRDSGSATAGAAGASDSTSAVTLRQRRDTQRDGVGEGGPVGWWAAARRERAVSSSQARLRFAARYRQQAQARPCCSCTGSHCGGGAAAASSRARSTAFVPPTGSPLARQASLSCASE